MQYISVTEASEKWGVSLRQVQRLLAANRIPNAKKYGRSWMIPDDAEKPGDLRHENKQTQSPSTLSSDLDEVLAATNIPLPRENPDAALDTISERLRLFGEEYLASLRGDFERAKQCFREIGDDDAVKLKACSTAIAAAIGTGDYPLYHEIESYCKDMVSANLGANVTSAAELALITAYVGAFVPALIPKWLKDGNFSSTPRHLIPEVFFLRVFYLYYLKKYESALDMAQGALAFDEPERGIWYKSIYLRIISAAACCALGRTDDAKDYLLDVMRDCLPHGFIAPLAGFTRHFGGLLEQLLKREYPEHYDAVTKLSERTVPNWLAFHNRLTKENITLILSQRDYSIARLAVRDVPYEKIAEQFNLSLGTLNNKMHEIYETLLISEKDRRRKLAEYIL